MANVLRLNVALQVIHPKVNSRAKPAPCIREKVSADLADKAESSILLDHYPLHQRNPWINFS
jgi:hypothetical protein